MRILEQRQDNQLVQAELFPNVSIGDAPEIEPAPDRELRDDRLRSRRAHVEASSAQSSADAELNLIPMIDILSVLVAFLLVYSTEVEVVQNTKGIEIPESIVLTKPRETVVVMLTKDEVFVQGERIASIAEVKASEDTIIAPLRDALKRPMLIGRKMAERELAEREITIMGDKSLPYEVLKKVMATCTDADYGKISLATVQKDKPLDPSVFKPQ